MMPHQDNPNDLSGVAATPAAMLPSTHKTPLRTYSRRSLKRRHTSPPAQHVERFLTRTASLNVTEQNTVEQRCEVKDQQPSRPISNKDRKRLRFALPSAEKKTPNELAWEALTSSAPVLTRQDDDPPNEGGPHEARVVECTPGHEASEHQQLDVEDALKGPTKGREDKPREDAASETGATENMSLEESDDVEDGEEQQLLADHHHR